MDTDVWTLKALLDAFNSPLNEEQAWAICYQASSYLHNIWSNIKRDENGRTVPSCCLFSGLECLSIGINGAIISIMPPDDCEITQPDTEHELVQCLGLTVFQALDYGLAEHEEQPLSETFESLIAAMTGSGSEPSDGDEQDAESANLDGDKMSLVDVKHACMNHLSSPSEAETHYQAVCRALVAEATELVKFLEVISKDKQKLRQDEVDGETGMSLEDLESCDWARLWIQVMRSLRQGVTLKKVETTNMPGVIYELTPYETLMNDIRSKNFNLKPVTISGDHVPHAKKDAHEIILEFIRSRPPLTPIKERKMKDKPINSSPRDDLMNAIRTEAKLRPIPKRTVETSRTQLDEKDSSNVQIRKVIKPDLSLLVSNSFDAEEDEFDGDLNEEYSSEDQSSDVSSNVDNRKKVAPVQPMDPFTPLKPAALPSRNWQQTVMLDLATQGQCSSPERRHTITVCESPLVPLHKPSRLNDIGDGAPPTSNIADIILTPDALNLRLVDVLNALAYANSAKSGRTSFECLSLSIEEVMHIRSVLTKAELECLVCDNKLLELLNKGKVCFICRKQKFSLFGQWGTRCKFCRRNICSKCISKMRIPVEHFDHVPVHALSPGPPQPFPSDKLESYTCVKTGSAPNSPELPKRLSKPLPDLVHTAELKMKPIQPQPTAPKPPKTLQGPMMNLCKDCKTMVISIIKAGRATVTLAPDLMS